jgi:predicted nucleic acid-binding protein
LILLDASGVLAWIDRHDAMHQRVAAAMETVNRQMLLSPFVLAELDHLLRTRMGQAAQGKLLSQVARRVFELSSFGAGETALAIRFIERFRDLRISLADASIVVLAHKHGIREVLTLDERDFRVLPGPGGKPFRILPADA